MGKEGATPLESNRGLKKEQRRWAYSTGGEVVWGLPPNGNFAGRRDVLDGAGSVTIAVTFKRAIQKKYRPHRPRD